MRCQSKQAGSNQAPVSRCTLHTADPPDSLEEEIRSHISIPVLLQSFQMDTKKQIPCVTHLRYTAVPARVSPLGSSAAKRWRREAEGSAGGLQMWGVGENEVIG